MKKILPMSLLTLALLPAVSKAQILTPIERLTRCYTQLTGRSLPLNSPHRTAVLNGTKTSEQICGDFLDQALLENSTYKTNASFPEGLLVLRHLNSFHRTWFSRQVFEQMQAYDELNTVGTHDLYDSTEMALMITYSMFAPSAAERRYDQVVLRNQGVYALREIDAVSNTIAFPSGAHTLPSRRLQNRFGVLYSEPIIGIKKNLPFAGANLASSDSLTFTPVQVGELVGIQPEARSSVISNYYPNIKILTSPNPYVPSVTTENALITPGITTSFDIFQSLGGGILGLPSFLLVNWGHEPGRLNDGSLKLPRRWVEQSMESLLCKEFPTVRETDVLAMIDSSGDPNVAPFRVSRGCVMCHATLDPFAYVARNYFVASSDYASRSPPSPVHVAGRHTKNARIIGRFNGTEDVPYNWSSKPVTDFHKQKPLGKVFFRSFDGTLINQPVSNLSEATSVLAGSKDLYQCAAKRYFEYLTGIDVALYDRGDIRFVERTARLPLSALRQRQFVEKIGADLKEHQSLRQVIKDILASKYYWNSQCRQPAGCD